MTGPAEGSSAASTPGGVAGQRRGALEVLGMALGKAARDRAGAGNWTADWRAREIIVLVLGAIALLATRAWALGLPEIRRLDLDALVAARAGIQIAYYAASLGLLAAVARWKNAGFGATYGLVRFRVFSSVGMLVAMLIGVRLFSILYGAATQALGWFPPAAADPAALFGPGLAGFVLACLTVVVLGPFVEEVVFRGAILGYLDRVMDRRAAIALSAVLFASSHMTLWTFVPLVVLGSACGWLVTSRGSVWPAVILHGLYNAVAIVATFYVAGGAS
ncbi:MAG: hypothetical protein Kow0056_14690 [Coriobacteriia bacterium]